MKNSKQTELLELDRSTGEVTETITIPIVKNWLNKHLFPKDYEENNSLSLTIPDQSMSVSEMLERQAKGLPISFNAGTPYFLGDEEMPDIHKMDLSEIQDLREFIAEKKAQAQEEAVAARKRNDAKLQEELQEFRKAKAAQAEAQKSQQDATQEGGVSRI